MIKTVSVMNKSNAEKLLNSIADNKRDSKLVISIRTPGDEKANLGNNAYDILFLSFCDCDNSNDPTITLISKQDTDDIVTFIHKYNKINKEFDLIIHCDAGRSRSAGVGAAIEKYLFGYDNHYFNNSVFNPNILCYREVLNSFMEMAREN